MTRQGISTVARQEFRLRIRAGAGAAADPWFVLLLVFTVLLRVASGPSRDDRSDRGVILFGGLMLFVLGLALLVVPALAAQSVNGDRERGTLATLQVTRLTPATSLSASSPLPGAPRWSSSPSPCRSSSTP